MEKTAIQFSGGKDSLAVLHMLKPHTDEVTAYFCDTGDMYQHIKDLVVKTCENLNVKLKIVRPKMDIKDFHKENGLPSDIVPISKIEAMRDTFKNKGASLQGSVHCCSLMLWKPLHDAMIEDDIRVIVRGAKKADAHMSVPDGFIDERGVKYKNPLWEMTDNEVFKYLRENNIELPKHYSEVNCSFDCVGCSAFLYEAGTPGRLAWTKKNLPERWEYLRARINTVRSVLEDETNRAKKSFMEAL